MPKITVTHELLDQYPHLVDLGILVGQEIDSEEYDVPLEDQQSQNGQNLDDDPPTGEPGGNNPKKPNLP